MTTQQQAASAPLELCQQGSLLRQSAKASNALAEERKRQARKADQLSIEAQRRHDFHRACCPRCGGA